MSCLSLLSRGTGEVIRKKQEKLEVQFDPEDYLNWTSPETHFHISQLLNNSQVLEESWRLCLPKTYSTRTGPLVLYSEDLAKPSRRLKECRKFPRRIRNKSQILNVEIHTLQDLVRAILAYGNKEIRTNKKGIAWQPYLHFLSEPEFQTDRQMRPGYSAKRYLLKLSQTWDPSILQKLQSAGYIRDPLLLEENSQDDRKKQQDLSAVPPKYNLLHIFYSSCPYLQAELEDQQINTGLGPSSQKQSKNKVRLVENSEEEKNIGGRARIPLRISVRKLSFHLRQQRTKETIWRQDTAYQRIPGERWSGVHQDGEAAKEEPGHRERPNQSGDYPTLANPIIDTSDLWCEQSHVTFYGGFFPGRKFSYSVNQRHLKNTDGRESGTSVGTGLFPPIHPGTISEQCVVTKERRKQVPDIFRLPHISEDSPRAPWTKCTSSELSKELVVLPLLVHLGRETQIKVKRLKGTYCNEPQSKTDACNKHLTPLTNDLILESDYKRDQEQMTSSQITDSSQVSFCLPPISNKQYAVRRRKTRKTEVCAENNSKYERAREAEVPTEMRMVSRSPPETSSEVQELDGKVPLHVKYELPQTQQIGNRYGFKNEEKTAGHESIFVEFRKGNQQSQGALYKNSSLLQNEEERGNCTLPQTQSLKQQNSNDFMQAQGCGLDPWDDTGKQLENFPQSGSLLHLKQHLAHSLISASEMESIPESSSVIKKLLDHGEEIEESTRMDLSSSEKEFGTEEHNIALPKKTSKQVKDTSRNTAASILENKLTRRQKKHELVKVGVVSKVQKNNVKKNNNQRQTGFVVGKPRQKKAAGKTAAFSKEKPAGVRRSEPIEEPHQKEEERGGDADLEQIDSFGDGEGQGGREKEANDDDDDLGSATDQSCPLSTPLQEEHPLLLQEDQLSPEDAGHASASQVNSANNKPIAPHPVIPTANGSQTDAVHSKGRPENLPQNKEEEKLSREKIIAERAEKRRLAVERKRQEQEELKRKAQEQQERMERMKEEMQQEQQRRIEEMRLRKQQLEEEHRRQEEEAERTRQAEKAAQERIRQQQEEYRRKLLEMQKKKQEEEQERAEAEKRRQKERETQLEEERQRLAEMAKEQRLEYEKKKQEEEEKMRHKAEERRKRAEEEARIALEEARKQALLLARQREQLERQQQFQYKLFVEASGLERGQNISRPWVYSYFQHSFLKVGDDD